MSMVFPTVSSASPVSSVYLLAVYLYSETSYEGRLALSVNLAFPLDEGKPPTQKGDKEQILMLEVARKAWFWGLYGKSWELDELCKIVHEKYPDSIGRQGWSYISRNRVRWSLTVW